MPIKPNRPNRRSIRLKDYDYSSPGAYFITISTHNNVARFGKILKGEMRPNEAGQMITNAWLRLPERFPSVQLDEYVVMPTHLQAVLILLDGHDDRIPIGRIVGAYKSITTVEYIRRVRSHQWPAIDQRLWQRNYYEKIVRSQRGLDAVRKYIRQNPLAWELEKSK